jgi:uncharacterized protein YxjI
MPYVMKQKLWSLGADFTIKDAAGQDRFFVDGKALSLGDKLSFQDMAGHELAFIRQKLLAWGPTYELERNGQLVAVVKQKLWTLFRNRFTVDVDADGPSPTDLEVQGDFWDHEYTFTRAGQVVATVSKRYFSWTDTYGVDIAPGEDDIFILACTVIVDMATQKKNND